MLSQESKEKMKLWLSLWPESGHAEDEKRKVDFIKSLKAHGEIVDFNDLYDCYREINLSYLTMWLRKDVENGLRKYQILNRRIYG